METLSNEILPVLCSTCTVNGIERLHGESWPSESDTCRTCQCKEGVTKCEKTQCDCSARHRDLHCCPQCNHDKVCLHQEDRTKVFKSGQRWNYDCQTCECIVSVHLNQRDPPLSDNYSLCVQNGEIDCWSECPPANCLNPIRETGDCCFRCEDDPCQSKSTPHGNVSFAGCRHLNKEYRSGQLVTVHPDKCTSCLCQVSYLLSPSSLFGQQGQLI